MYPIDYNRYRSVKSFNSRVRFLVMHYTAANFKSSINTLTGDSVSAHYMVPDPTEKTYIDAGFKDMRVFNLVNEYERAWHAGVSTWRGRNNINDSSIGIEIVNLATDDNRVFNFPPFNSIQIDAVKELSLNILQRYPDITPTNVVAHSDIAPSRKSDPGAAFPWKQLYDVGIGAWYDEAVKEKYECQICRKAPDKTEILAKFRRYGYDVSIAASDNGYKDLIRAFQLHFRQEKYDGILDVETTAILCALVDKYYS